MSPSVEARVAVLDGSSRSDADQLVDAAATWSTRATGLLALALEQVTETPGRNQAEVGGAHRASITHGADARHGQKAYPTDPADAEARTDHRHVIDTISTVDRNRRATPFDRSTLSPTRSGWSASDGRA